MLGHRHRDRPDPFGGRVRRRDHGRQRFQQRGEVHGDLHEREREPDDPGGHLRRRGGRPRRRRPGGVDRGHQQPRQRHRPRQSGGNRRRGVQRLTQLRGVRFGRLRLQRRRHRRSDTATGRNLRVRPRHLRSLHHHLEQHDGHRLPSAAGLPAWHEPRHAEGTPARAEPAREPVHPRRAGDPGRDPPYSSTSWGSAAMANGASATCPARSLCGR